ncbi:mechanosensitive ion channel domain-containing protein [Dyella sp. Tek66A03]|uniref:mechanosensitive ion channel domain-containing protein n=1 Tax=Dyella sp. Tek66A03 TaxID=3458298 RepID=UPI00403E792B
MNPTDRGMLFGFGVFLLDFLAWRFLTLDREWARFGIRSSLFLILSYVLWTIQISPFHVAPWADQPIRHLLAQGLGFLWWLQAAQISATILGRIALPSELRRERLFQDIFRAIVFLAAAVAAVSYVLELPLGGLLATSGAMAIILGLAVQSTLSDVFSGLVLNATQPFHVGDTVAIGDIQGDVVERTWRATTLLNNRGNFVLVPNSAAAKASIVNLSRPPQLHGITVRVRISPTIRPALVISGLEDAISGTADVLADPKPSITALVIHRNFIEYEILAYVASADKQNGTQNEIIDQAHLQLNARGIYLGREQPEGGSREGVERLLRNIDMFKCLNDAQIAQLASASVSQRFSAGELIYNVKPDCPDEHRALCIVAEGVAILLAPHDGKDIELQRLAPGDAVGRSGVLTGVSNGIKLRALSNVSVFRLNKDAITPLLRQFPELAKEMLSDLLECQAREAEILREIPSQETERGGVFQRLMEGLRRLHGIVRR